MSNTENQVPKFYIPKPEDFDMESVAHNIAAAYAHCSVALRSSLIHLWFVSEAPCEGMEGIQKVIKDFLKQFEPKQDEQSRNTP